LDNDPLEARCYTNLVCNFLYYSNRIDASSRDSLNLAMYEILINAIEHGNCGITYEDKTAWLRDHGSITGLIEKRHADPEIARRRVVFEYTISRSASCFFVGDEGAGFDWRGMEEATGPRRLLEMHGRGILLARSATRNLTYNEKGNEVRFELAHQNDEASLTPSLLDGMAPRKIAPGEFVFREDDPGNFLYYIVKGRYDVLVGDRIVAGLSPEDIFLGEMSFLLNNRRSASVRARSAGKLIEISKKSFVDAIREHPHYALLLSRLLAQRIERSNKLLDR
jgi:CRP-like cAMP-binding protein